MSVRRAFSISRILGHISVGTMFLLGMTPACQHSLPGDFTPGDFIVKKGFFIDTLVLLSKFVLISLFESVLFGQLGSLSLIRFFKALL